MDSQKQQVVAKLKDARNVLVTVSSDPSVDQLAACLGLTLMLNKLGKHATAVFSGQVPSTIDFLKPETTLETNTNSLRDFIIALDKSKADKLRYKVEDKVVRIFITPYRTSIGQEDLEFSEGDFNVDVVIALGVNQQQDIDQAVTAHGNILHDATVITVTTSDESGLGSIHWRDPAACGVSELAASLADSFDKNLLDEQIATALLTGIVAQTNRFSNDLTTSNTMKISAQLMGAGANQQLVATKLEESHPIPAEPADLRSKSSTSISSDESAEPARKDPGLLEIDHDKTDGVTGGSEPGPSRQTDEPEAPKEPENGDDEDSTRRFLQGDGPDIGQLTANSHEEPLDPTTDPLSLPPLDRDFQRPAAEEKARSIEPPSTEPEPEAAKPATPAFERKIEPEPSPPPMQKPDSEQTLNDIEASVHSPHLGASQAAEPSDQPLPSVSVGPDGSLVHNTSTVPQPGELKPAPGFESAQPTLNMPTPPLTPPPGLAGESPKNDGNPPPPLAPPPFLPPR